MKANIQLIYTRKCVGGDGDYSIGYQYSIKRNNQEVLRFTVDTYEKEGHDDNKNPLTIITNPVDHNHIEIQVNTFYCDFTFESLDGGLNWELRECKKTNGWFYWSRLFSDESDTIGQMTHKWVNYCYDHSLNKELK